MALMLGTLADQHPQAHAVVAAREVDLDVVEQAGVPELAHVAGQPLEGERPADPRLARGRRARPRSRPAGCRRWRPERPAAPERARPPWAPDGSSARRRRRRPAQVYTGARLGSCGRVGRRRWLRSALAGAAGVAPSGAVARPEHLRAPGLPRAGVVSPLLQRTPGRGRARRAAASGREGEAWDRCLSRTRRHPVAQRAVSLKGGRRNQGVTARLRCAALCSGRSRGHLTLCRRSASPGEHSLPEIPARAALTEREPLGNW